MDKASKALRRSSVRLKSLGSGHRNLNMVISELRDVRSSAKAFMMAQNTAAQDLLKWSLSNENQVLQDTFVHLAELSALWMEVQKEFTEHLKEFIYQFEMILEGECHVDQARTHMASCEQREMKIQKELEKASRKSNSEDIHVLEAKLSQAEQSRNLAQIDVMERVQENEAVKLLRVKEGLLKLSESYLELAHKCHIIHETQRLIAYQIPDVHGKKIWEIKYAGSHVAKKAIATAKEQVHCSPQNARPSAPLPEDAPPPYSPSPASASPLHCTPSTSRVPTCCESCPFPGNGTTDMGSLNGASNELHCDTNRRMCTFPARNSNSSSLNGTMQSSSEYEDDLSGAMRRLKP